MLTFIIVFLGLSLLILGHEAGHFFVAKRFGMKIDEFGFGFPPRAFSRKKKGIEYSVNWLPFGGFVKIAGEDGIADDVPPEERKRYFFAQSATRRALVIAAGIIINFALGWIFLTTVFAIGTPSLVVVGDVIAGSPAAAAGIKTGDILKDFKTSGEFISFVNSHAGGTVPFSVYRDNQEISFNVPTELRDGSPRVGLALEEGGAPKLSLGRAMAQGFRASIRVGEMTLIAFKDLIVNLFGHGKLLEGVVGPVGIFSVAETTGRFGLIYLLQLLGIISINLAVANLIPFPALDGGRLFLILVEKIKGSPVPKKVEGLLNGIGFALLLIIMVLVTFRDITNWIR